MIWYRIFVTTLFLFSSIFSIEAQPESGNDLRVLERHPNILIFTVDSCRADRFGVYGNTERLTPNIDRWAATGTVFLNAYSTSAWTAPGLVSILTGLYPATHGVDNRDRTGSPDLVTLPKLFRSLGYRVPNLNFFTFAPYYKNLGLSELERGYFGDKEGEELLNWLDANANRDSPHPFFLWYHSVLVHQPYHPGTDRLPRPLEELEKSEGLRAVLKGAIVPVGSARFLPEDRPLLEALYNAEIKRLDELFGEVIRKLQEKGILSRTLLVFTADHGEELLDHGFVGHASTSLQAKLYEELIRIPLILSWPDQIPRLQKVERPVSQIDLFPTLLRLVKVKSEKEIEGTDLFQGSARQALFFESVISGNQTPRSKEDQWIRAVRRGDLKYIDSGELYDLSRDPGERVNLAAQKPEIAGELNQLLREWVSRHKGAQGRLPAGEVMSAHDSAGLAGCPRIFSPENGSTLDFDTHTGALLFDWSGLQNGRYLIEYDIGRGDHQVSGRYEVEGSHQILGPFPRELWTSLKAWNPFRIRVSPLDRPGCWSDWVEFRF